MTDPTTPDPTADDGPLAAVEGLWAAIIRRDADAIVDNYAGEESLHVFVEGPRWQTIGHDAVSRGWRDFCTSPLRVTAIDVTDGPRVFGESGPARLGAQATVSAMTRLTYGVVGDDETRQVTFRLTWVLGREADRWRIVHEHASQPVADPYGTGDWLRDSGS